MNETNQIGKSNSNIDAEAIQSLQVICEGISKQRAIDLLVAANSNLERAIDIFFHQQQQQQQEESQRKTTRTTGSSLNKTNKKKKPTQSNNDDSKNSVLKRKSTSPLSSPKKGMKNATKEGTTISSPQQRASKQAKIQSFFGSNKSPTAKFTPENKYNSRQGNKVDARQQQQQPVESLLHSNEEVVISIDDDSDDDDDDDDSKHNLLTKSIAVSEKQQGNKYNSDKHQNTDMTTTSQPNQQKDAPTVKSTTSSPPPSKLSSSSASTSTSKTTRNDSIVDSNSFKEETSFQRLTDTLQQMADTTKRLVKLAVLEQFIRDIIDVHLHPLNTTTTDDDDNSKTSDSTIPAAAAVEATKVLTCALLLVLGCPSSNDQPPLEVSGSAVSKSLQTILGVSRMQLSKAYRKYGDLGCCAASYFQKRGTNFFVKASNIKYLSIINVYDGLQQIIRANGRDAKQRIIMQLMRKCQTKTELRFLVRLLICNMRIGASLKTVLASLAMAIGNKNDGGESGDDNNTTTTSTATIKKSSIEAVQKTHDICPNLERIINSLLLGGIERMKQECGIQVLTPIGPMLAHPTHTLDQIQKAMETTTNNKSNSMIMEWKYDGVRCQAHYDGTTIKLFSRHMLETTAQYPDAANNILGALCDLSKSSTQPSFIIDSEIVGVDDEGRLLPFQDLSRRKRTDDGKSGVRVKVFAFDLMYLNGQSYIDKPLWERQHALRNFFRKTDDFDCVSSEILPSYDETKIRSFLEGAVKNGAEGLMLKMLGKSIRDVGGKSHDDEAVTNKNSVGIGEGDEENNNNNLDGNSPYEAGTRSHSWLKVKRDYVDGYADTIDVVPIGAWHGSGRKAQKSFLSPVLLAVYDEDEDVFRSISRCMSFSDDMYEAMREFYFYGVPYPVGVGIDTTRSDVQQEEANCQSIQEVIEDDDDSGSEQEAEEESNGEFPSNSFDGGKREEDEETKLVNCFPSRPSSAHIITNEQPTFWFKPLEVFEVSFADMSLSRQHTAAGGLIDDSEGHSGIALRFPRFKRRRPDKKPTQATTCSQIADLFSKQSKQTSRGGEL